MVGVTPSQIAMLFLKINIALFIVTLGANSLAIFPYIMHTQQVANYIAMDIANRNYIKSDDVSKFVSHFDFEDSHPASNTYSKFTFKDREFDNVTTESELKNNLDYYTTQRRGQETAFNVPIALEPNDYRIGSGAQTTVAVSAEVLQGPKADKSLIINRTDFSPLTNITHLKQGMDGFGNSVLVNRGTPFKVTLKTRYKLTGYAFGFKLHSAIPITVASVGVTTQYYQYDN